MTERRRVLVTGASGYLGGALARGLEADGVDVVRAPGRRDMDRLDEIAGSSAVDAVVHAGFAVDFSPAVPGEPESENVRTARLLGAWVAARRTPHVVFLSAGAVLGVSGEPQARSEEDRGRTDPGFEATRGTRYVRDKLIAEDILGGGPGVLTTLYLTTVYGPGMPRETRRALAKAGGWSPFLPVPPGGTSFLALADLSRAVTLVLERRPAGRFVLSSGNASYRLLYETAAAVLGTRWRPYLVTLPRAAGRAAGRFGGRFLTGAVLASAFGYKYYSPEKARRAFGWTPRVSLREALAEALGAARG